MFNIPIVITPLTCWHLFNHDDYSAYLTVRQDLGLGWRSGRWTTYPCLSENEATLTRWCRGDCRRVENLHVWAPWFWSLITIALVLTLPTVDLAMCCSSGWPLARGLNARFSIVFTSPTHWFSLRLCLELLWTSLCVFASTVVWKLLCNGRVCHLERFRRWVTMVHDTLESPRVPVLWNCCLANLCTFR